MTYNAITKRFEIDPKQLDYVASLIIGSIRLIREQANLPLDGYKWDKPLDSAQFAEARLMDLARALDINLGVSADQMHYIGVVDAREKR